MSKNNVTPLFPSTTQPDVDLLTVEEQHIVAMAKALGRLETDVRTLSDLMTSYRAAYQRIPSRIARHAEAYADQLLQELQDADAFRAVYGHEWSDYR